MTTLQDETRPAVGKPPFQDLVKPGTEPAKVPGFDPIDPPEDLEPRPTLGERWQALGARRQKLILGGAIGLLACGVFFWPKPTVALPPRVERPADPPPPTIVPGPTQLVVVPEPPRPKYLMTVGPIPPNTQVTRENIKTLFREHEDTFAPPGIATPSDTIIGKFVVANLNAGQLAPKSAFADQPLRPTETAVAPPPRAVGPTKTHEMQFVTSSGTRVVTYEFWPADGWRVASEKFVPGGAR